MLPLPAEHMTVRPTLLIASPPVPQRSAKSSRGIFQAIASIAEPSTRYAGDASSQTAAPPSPYFASAVLEPHGSTAGQSQAVSDAVS